MDGNPVNQVHANHGTVPENHADTGLDPIPEDHVDARTIPTLRNHVNKETVHIRTGMLTEVRTLSRIKGLTTLLWMP